MTGKQKTGIKKNTWEETDRNDEKAIELIETKIRYVKARQKKNLFKSLTFGTKTGEGKVMQFVHLSDIQWPSYVIQYPSFVDYVRQDMKDMKTIFSEDLFFIFLWIFQQNKFHLSKMFWNVWSVHSLTNICSWEVFVLI